MDTGAWDEAYIYRDCGNRPGVCRKRREKGYRVITGSAAQQCWFHVLRLCGARDLTAWSRKWWKAQRWRRFFISSVRSPPSASTSRPSAMTPASEIEYSNKFSLPARSSLRIIRRLYTGFQRVRAWSRSPQPTPKTTSRYSLKIWLKIL